MLRQNTHMLQKSRRSGQLICSGGKGAATHFFFNLIAN